MSSTARDIYLFGIIVIFCIVGIAVTLSYRNTVASFSPTAIPSMRPSLTPSRVPSNIPTKRPSMTPSLTPSRVPSNIPSKGKGSSARPSLMPSLRVSFINSSKPTFLPTNLLITQSTQNISTSYYTEETYVEIISYPTEFLIIIGILIIMINILACVIIRKNHIKKNIGTPIAWRVPSQRESPWRLPSIKTIRL